MNETRDDFEDRIRAALTADAGRAPLARTAPALGTRRGARAGRPRLRTALGAAATAAAVVAVLGATSLLPHNSAGRPGPTGAGTRPSVGQSVPRNDAAAFLHAAAQAALGGLDPVPGPNQFIFTESFTRYGVTLAVVPPARSGSLDSAAPSDSQQSLPTPSASRVESLERRIWLSADGRHDGVLHTRPKSSTGAWALTPLPGCHPAYVSPGAGKNGDCPAYPSYQASLPTKPDAMFLYLNSISGGETHPPGEPDRPTNPRLFSSAMDLLGEQMMPAASLAALYEAMAKIPGVTITRGATDILGRPAVGVGIVDGFGARRELLFGGDYRILGERWLLKGKPLGHGTAILRTAIVDKAGKLP